MVETQEMDNPVYQKTHEFIVKVAAGFTRLPFGGRCRDHHVAKHEKPGLGSPAILKWKRQHVRGPVLLSISGVQSTHSAIGNKKETQFRIVISRGSQNGFGRPF